MIRLRKYFKKYWVLFVLAIACIFGQALSELSLPDYMSNIVTNGIQAGGFDNAVSEVMSTATYDHLMLFVSGKNKTLIKKSYQFTKAEDVKASLYKTYTKAKGQDLYILKSGVNKDKLNDAMVKGMLIVYSLDTMDKDSSSYKKFMKQINKNLDKAESGYNKGLKGYNKGVKGYTTGLSGYKKGVSGYQTGVAQYNKMKKAAAGYDSAIAKLNASFGSESKAKAMQAALTAQIAATTDPMTKAQLQGQLKGVTAGVTAYGKLSQLAKLKASLPAMKKKLDAAKVKLDAAKKKLDAAKEKLASAKKKLDAAKAKIDKARANAKSGNFYYFLDAMTQKQRNKMFESVDKQMKTMGESTMKIAAGKAVKNEYKKLGVNTDKIQTNYIITAGVQMLVIALLGSIAAIVAALFASRVGSGVARDLRRDLFGKVESFSNAEINRFSTASLITRSTNDITQVQNVTIMFIRLVCFAPIMGIGGLIKAVNNSPAMTWVIVLVLVVLFVIMGMTMGIAMPKFKIIQSLIDKLNLSMRENLSGLLVIRAFGNEEESERRFDASNEDLTKVNLFVNRVMVSLIPMMMFVMNGVTLLIVYVGAKQIDLGNISIGQMMAFLQYGMMIIMSFLMVSMIAIMIPRASVSGKRIAEVLETKPEIVDPVTPMAFVESKRGVIEFDHVTFSYPGASEPVLNDITFTANPGETTAFIGSTGSGKSTLINLIPRFYEATQGSVKVDGVDIKNVKMHDLRERIGVVPQKGLLFSVTIRSNLTYGAHDATDEDLEKVAEVSQSKEFISTKEEGLDAPISQGGTNVSGGQKQRLAIARALAKNPEILIFDDSFSALDFKTDAALRKELNAMCAKTKNTVLLVGQRIASIMNAQQIIVLDEGKIVGKGTHDELMKNCKVYQEIAYSQLSKEELGNE